MPLACSTTERSAGRDTGAARASAITPVIAITDTVVALSAMVSRYGEPSSSRLPAACAGEPAPLAS